MLISHSHKFIFIHNYKAAGTSIRNALRPVAHVSWKKLSRVGKIKVLLKIHPPIYSKSFRHHIQAKELKNVLPANIYRNYFTFGLVRNPWDWQVSLYEYILGNEKHQHHSLVNSMSGFDEYIYWRVNEELKLQKEFFFDDEGEQLVDYIGRFEDLNASISYISKRIGFDFELPHLNRSRDDTEYLGHYSPYTIELVYDAFKEDIETFGYSKPNI